MKIIEVKKMEVKADCSAPLILSQSPSASLSDKTFIVNIIPMLVQNELNVLLPHICP